MKRMGTYVLIITLGSDLTTEVGALGTLSFPAGTYLYAGSALGGLDQRVSRHIRREKTVRWHIDRLTMVADSVTAYESYPDYIPECELASIAEDCGMVPFIDGFGCSDCSCRTHLLRVTEGSLDLLISRARLVPFRDRRNEIK
ncbi:MAG: DUF123 domain-containing protein [Candidatus Methanomethylophilaceae archaeon]